MKRAGGAAAFTLLVGAAACGPAHVNGNGDIDASSIDAPGAADAAVDSIPEPDALPCGTIVATVRDFQIAHPDFENGLGDDRGLVQTTLGGDEKPVYAPMGATTTVSGQASFDQWYRDVPDTNMTFHIPIALTEDPTAPGTFSFASSAFFPIDDMGFGNEGNVHNFHFTTEIHASFVYHGGEVFSFSGDDDVFIFVNDKLALDLGGVHGPETQSIDFDAMASTLGITTGNTYPIDMFHAERHTSQSNFALATTIECLIIE